MYDRVLIPTYSANSLLIANLFWVSAQLIPMIFSMDIVMNYISGVYLMDSPFTDA